MLDHLTQLLYRQTLMSQLQRSYDQATVKDNDIFGDRDLYRGLLSGYNLVSHLKKLNTIRTTMMMID